MQQQFAAAPIDIILDFINYIKKLITYDYTTFSKEKHFFFKWGFGVLGFWGFQLSTV